MTVDTVRAEPNPLYQRALKRPTRRGPLPSSVPVMGPYRREKVRLHRIAKGVPRLVPADRVRAHIDQLHRWGFSDTAIAAAASISQKTVWFIRQGTYPTSQVDRAARILAVTHRPVPAQAGMKLPNIGTKRRIQALMAIGWSQSALGARLGVSSAQISLYLRNDIVLYETWLAVAGLYEAIASVPGPSTRSMELARARGFASAIAWDGIDIDHPDSAPDFGDDEVAPEDEDAVRLAQILAGEFGGEPTKAEKYAVYDHAIENGWLPAKVAERLGMTKEAAERAILRRKAKLRKQEAA